MQNSCLQVVAFVGSVLPIVYYGFGAESIKSTRIILRRLSFAQRLVTGRNRSNLEEFSAV